MMQRSRGYTLVELMIAVTLGLMITAGVAAVLLSSSTIFRSADSRAQIQSGARFGMALLEEDVRMAGYMGCFNMNMFRSRMRNMSTNPTSFANNYAVRIAGFDASSATAWTPALEASIGQTGNHPPQGGTDVLVVRTPIGLSLPLSASMANTAEPIPLASVSKLEEGGLAVVSDCNYADIFRITQVPADRRILHANSLNADNTLSKAYSTTRNATLTPVATISYFVAPSASGVSGMRSLWRQQNADTAEEAVEGVHDLQIEYGVDTDGDLTPNRYVKASSLTAASAVSAVRLSMLLRSASDNVTTARSTYRFDGVSTTAADRRAYTPFTTTIYVRNQVN